MYGAMRVKCIKPNKYTIVSLLRACLARADLKEGKAIHAEAVKYGLHADLFVGTVLVDMYAKLGSIMDAQDVFDSLPQRDVVSWTAMLGAYVHHGQAETTLNVYQTMQEEGVIADSRTFVILFKACSILAGAEEEASVDGQVVKARSCTKGKALHADARRLGYDADLFVGNTLIGMYGRCGRVIDAEHVFNRLSQHNVVSWNAMLTSYAQWDQAKVLQVYKQMHEEGVSPDVRTFVSVLQACALLAEKEDNAILNGLSMKAKSLVRGKIIQAYACRKGHRCNIFMSSVLVFVFGRCGSIRDARVVFDETCGGDAASWNAILQAYLEHGNGQEVLHLYEKMIKACVSPDDLTYVSLFRACARLAENEAGVVVYGHSRKPQALGKCKVLHFEVCRQGCNSNVFIGSALISMYGKVGSMEDAQSVFDGLSMWSLASWNAILGAYLDHGQPETTLALYQRMLKTSIVPNEITFLCILQACGYTGSLNLCRQIHRSIVLSGRNDNVLLSSTLIHTYGRCASMVDAQVVFDGLVQPSLVSWTALIAGHARQGNGLESLRWFEKMRLTGITPDAVTFLCILSACSHAGLVDVGVEYFESMTRDYGVDPGVEHYASMIDMLGRAGYFQCVEDLLSSMPMQPDLAVWLCLLGACRKHGKVELGKRAFDCAIQLQPNHAAAYLLMWHLYVHAGMPDAAKEIDEAENVTDARKMIGQSWVEHDGEVYNFAVDSGHDREYQRLHNFLDEVVVKLVEGAPWVMHRCAWK